MLAHPLLLRSPCALFLRGLQGGGAISAAALIIISASKPPDERQGPSEHSPRARAAPGTGSGRCKEKRAGSQGFGVGVPPPAPLTAGTPWARPRQRGAPPATPPGSCSAPPAWREGTKWGSEPGAGGTGGVPSPGGGSLSGTSPSASSGHTPRGVPGAAAAPCRGAARGRDVLPPSLAAGINPPQPLPASGKEGTPPSPRLSPSLSHGWANPGGPSRVPGQPPGAFPPF